MVANKCLMTWTVCETSVLVEKLTPQPQKGTLFGRFLSAHVVFNQPLLKAAV